MLGSLHAVIASAATEMMTFFATFDFIWPGFLFAGYWRKVCQLPARPRKGLFAVCVNPVTPRAVTCGCWPSGFT